MNAGIYREPGAGAGSGLPLPRKNLWALTIATGVLALVAIVMSPMLLVFASGGAPAIAKVWRHVKEGGVFWMFLVLLLDFFAPVVLTVLGAFVVRGKKVGPFLLFLGASLPLLIGVFGAWTGQATALAAVASVESEIRARIMAEGTAETLSNDLLAGFVACGCAIVACAASASAAASIDVAAASRDEKRTNTGFIGAMIAGGLWVLVTIVLVVLRLRATGPLVLFTLFAVLAIVPFAVMAGRGASVLRRWHDREEASRVLGGIFVAGLCAVLGVLALERAAQASHTSLALHAISGESVDPSQQARILLEAIAAQRYGTLALVLHAVLGLATFGAAWAGSIGGGPRGLRHPMNASTIIACVLAVGCLVATGGLARARTNVAGTLTATSDAAGTSGVTLPTVLGDFSRRGSGINDAERLVLAGDGTERANTLRDPRRGKIDSSSTPPCATRYVVYADRAVRIESLKKVLEEHECSRTRLVFVAHRVHDPSLDAQLGDYRGFLGSTAYVETVVSKIPPVVKLLEVRILDDAIEIRGQRYPFPLPQNTQIDGARDIQGLHFAFRPTDTMDRVLALVTAVRNAYGWQLDDRVDMVLDIGLPPGGVMGGSFGDGKTTSKGPTVRMGAIQVNGRLPPEVVQRIVRQNFGRFRLCYENGLRKDPSLAGRVSVKFVIDRTGAVTTTQDGGSDLGDPAVVSCVVRAFGNMTFPQPEGGIVTVVYPFVFSPAPP